MMRLRLLMIAIASVLLYAPGCRAEGRSRAGEQDYRPFVEDGKEWVVTKPYTYNLRYTKTYYTDGDTIVDGRRCKKLMLRYEDYVDGTRSTSLHLCMYEEDARVYYYPAGTEMPAPPILLYDFNAAPGDTVALGGLKGYDPYVTCYRVWDRKQTVNEGGLFRGQLATVHDPMLTEVDEDDPFPFFEWYEGIGSEFNPFAKTYWNRNMSGGPESLRSCTVAGKRIYYMYFQDDDITDVTDVRESPSRDGTTYTIDGKAVKGKPRKGLYIEDKQKILY